MANDIEKQNEKLEKQNEKLEKQNRKLKKRSKAGGKIILFLLLIIAVLAAVIFFFDPFGFGIGPNANKKGGGSDPAPASSASAAETTVSPEDPSETTKPQAYTDITVSGSTYVFGAEESDLDNIISVITKYTEEHHESVIAKIFDDNATVNAMEELKTALENAGIEYIMQS